MSRKQTSKPVRSNKKSELERKRDERAARRAIVKDRKNRPQEGDEGAEFASFSIQLQSLGLKLREVPGDGNCLFRALGDQLEGHSRGHQRLRQETVQYMMSYRQDFEPFVEDDVPFTQHLSSLSQPGTFAGNDAIVAFARSQQVKVVIHQLNTPLWEINGAEKQVCRELHIAYRYGDHYDSVRRIGDNSESPAQLRIENMQNSPGQQREFGDGQRERQKNSSPTALEEDNVILCSIKNRGIQVDEENLLQLSAATINAEWLVGSVLGQSCQGQCSSGSCSACRATATDCSEHKQSAEGSNIQKPKVSNKQRKEQQRQEKKKRQEERHRQKFLQSNGSQDQNQNLSEAVTLVPALNTLSI
ncbi:OTU domain-containing protein 3 isoform X2 [Paralichthys olivaceus]|uniref:OTU domain-containing protein 3 isoform X2 n=1 Tax=Paralichthys olivaceus TaxID=8255 RepID=UPI00097D3B41|nr:PREDICTED: OTU domain-containing protein 3 isoform X2 [Paralichthys olivaceus]